MVGSPMKKQRSSVQGLDGVVQGGDGAANVANAGASVTGSNTSNAGETGLEVPAAAFAGFGNGLNTKNDFNNDTAANGPTRSGGMSGQGASNEAAKQSIAAATALPDEDEEL